MKNITINNINLLILSLILAVCGIARAQAVTNELVWVTTDSGFAQYLDPQSMEWVPLTARDKIPLKTYLMVHPDSKITLYYQTEVYPLPSNSYFFLDDVRNRNQDQLVKALTRIEASHLPASTGIDSETSARKIGITYGNETRDNEPGIPNVSHLKERKQAIYWFLDQGRYDASLLMLKRMITQYPMLYKEKDNFDLLCTLYNKLNLIGFLHNETQKLMKMDIDEELKVVALNWKKIIEEKIGNE